MRPIKFRAWDRKEKKMHNVCRLGINGFSHDFWSPDQYCDSRISDTERYEFIQFTGLLDKNRKEGYHHDIWRGPYGGFWIVEWDEKQGKWYLKGQDKKDAPITCLIDGEIIGSIYENPELVRKA